MAAVEPHNPYAVPAQWRPPARPAPSRRWQVVILGAACALPSLAWVIIGSGVQYSDSPEDGRVLAILRLSVTLAAIAPALFFGVQALRPSAPRRRWLLAPALIALDLAVLHGLALLLPFRPGLLSVLVFALPPFALAGAVVLRSRAALLAAVGTLLGVFVLALPLRAMQQELGVRDLLLGTGIPSRSLLQPVLSPDVQITGMSGDGHRAVFVLSDQADLDNTGGISDGFDKSAVETVSSGYSDPCGRLLPSADGENLTSSPFTPCLPEPGGLWTDGANRYVLQRDGLTITLASAGMSTLDGGGEVRQAILATHPATEPELRSLEGWFPSSLLGLLLL
ncbi:hypothetical protein P3T36_004074 [Kitasatospora sp. MAP12-15]|uniref:hypothetical protein n=1 Tax=unclassified Kitasatospora TaxID=2633591 RepID=UPI00247479D1|nr:hypothetical protein [Kitasatospora sp. MAP12-44]MDH6115155.1 hypothetical protein [Kitasatospora sp. MAP12-44]